ncbi:TPA: hypothetical protein ACWZTV_004730 [Klebsiella pneumoniae]|nr:Uncharacterised protein [Klebsiella pneumoniae]VGK14675.1 Uncharacterised protein [Klebsiella pneumoniae]HEE5106829.1 hypothetical protein [Klebsiella pneumoniae]
MMASPSAHKAIRIMALNLASIAIKTRFNNDVKLSHLTGDINFDNILASHCDEVHARWRNTTLRGCITLNWHRQMHKGREQIDVSIHCNGQLCGLMLCRYSRRRINVNLRFLEGCPHPHLNPLIGYIMPIGLIIAENFAIAYEAEQVSISNPEKLLIPRYRDHGYGLTQQDKDRERRKCPIRGKLLIKKIQG